MASPRIDVGGLAAGLERGMRMRMARDQQKMGREQFDRQAQLDDLNMTLKNMQMEELRDDQYRRLLQRDIKATLHYLDGMREDPNTYMSQLNQHPKLANGLQKSMKNVGDFIVNRGVKDGMPREFSRLVPIDKERFALEMNVQRPDGNVYQAPYTEHRSTDSKDAVKTFTLEEIAKDLYKLDALTDMYESALIQTGDDTPIAQRSAARGLQAKRGQALEERRHNEQFQREMLGLKHENALELSERNVRSGGGAVQGDIQLMEYLVSTGVAQSREEAFRLAKTMKTDPAKAVIDIAKVLQQADANNFYEPKPFDNYIQEAESAVNNIYNRFQSGTGSTSTGTDVARPRTQAEFDALPSGTLFIDPNNGQRYYKP